MKQATRGRPKMLEIERFSTKYVETERGCWTWTASKTVDGYGNFKFFDTAVGSVRSRAHRFAYQYYIGPIPAGLELDHLCRNRACVNPAHLEPVTTKENAYRGLNPIVHPELRRKVDKDRMRTCIRGHQVDPATSLRDSKGYTRCRVCDRIGLNLRRHRAKSA